MFDIEDVSCFEPSDVLTIAVLSIAVLLNTSSLVTLRV